MRIARFLRAARVGDIFYVPLKTREDSEIILAASRQGGEVECRRVVALHHETLEAFRLVEVRLIRRLEPDRRSENKGRPRDEKRGNQ